MKIIFCTTVLPSPKTTGGEIASQSFIDALRACGNTVDVLGYRRPAESRPLADGEQMIGERLIESSADLPSVALWLGRAFLKGSSYSCEKYVSSSYLDKLRSISPEDYDLVVMDHAQMGFALDILSSLGLPIVFIAHNVEQNIYAGQAVAASRAKRAVFLREARLVGALERHLAHSAEQIWTLTTTDAAHFRSSGARLVGTFAVPSVMTEAPQKKVLQDCCFDWDIGMMGTWSWGANADGLRWFTDQVLPHLPAHIRIGVAGKGADWLDSFDPRITRLGFVDNALDFLATCKVICIPSIAGGGLQIKTLDAIATGRPTVATSFALRGIEDVPETVLVADDPQAFAERLNHIGLQASKPSSTEAFAWVQARLSNFQSSVQASLASLLCNATKEKI